MIETPIPQSDVAGNAQIRNHIRRPLAMHYGSPPILTTLQEDVADGFVVCAGAHGIAQQSAVSDVANKPFWLQLVGTGITTTWAAHLGAVCPQSKWPAITCMNIWESQLLADPIQLRGGYYRVPEQPGLGIEIDLQAIEQYRVDYSWVDPPRHVYRYAAPTAKSPTTAAPSKTSTTSTPATPCPSAKVAPNASPSKTTAALSSPRFTKPCRMGGRLEGSSRSTREQELLPPPLRPRRPAWRGLRCIPP